MVLGMTDEDAQNQTPAPAAPQVPPITLEIAITNLPDEIAEFGIVERLEIPGDLVEQLRTQTPVFRDMMHAALHQQFARVGMSLAETLANVLAYRAETGAPATHQGYIDYATAAVEQAQAARLAAVAEARAAAKAVAGDGGGQPVG